jgi:hypothetical protein
VGSFVFVLVFWVGRSRHIGSPKESRPELGHAPPCRSFRSLVVFSEFNWYTTQIEQAMSREDIAAANLAMKPFKAAYADLLSMCKASVSRLKTTVDSLTKKAADEKVAATAASSSRGRGRPKKTAAEGSLALTHRKVLAPTP